MFSLLSCLVFGFMMLFAKVEKLSKNKGVSMAQISIAWILSKDGKSALVLIQQSSGLKSLCILGVTSVVAALVIGTTSLDNLYDIVGKFILTDAFLLETLTSVFAFTLYSLGGLDVSLTSDEVKYLEEAYRPMPILGHT